MLGTLIETHAPRRRRLGGTVVSIALHTAIIGLVVAMTARATPRPKRVPPGATSVVYLPPQPAPPAAVPVAPSVPSLPAIPTPPRLVIPPIAIPTRLPSIDARAIVTNPNWYDTRSGPVPAQLAGDGAGRSSGPATGAWDASSVDRAVMSRSGNAPPIYPSVLRAARLEGTVDVRFVVDTTGRAEPSSIQMLAATHPLFADAVREALLRSRYQPAEAHGHRVRQVVEQHFEFALRR